jgi:hypothetical protein
LTQAKYHQVEDCDPIPDDTKDKVRRVVCSYAEGDTVGDQVAAAEEMMMMLGVHPSQDNDEAYRVGVTNLPNPQHGATSTPPLMRPDWR